MNSQDPINEKEKLNEEIQGKETQQPEVAATDPTVETTEKAEATEKATAEIPTADEAVAEKVVEITEATPADDVKEVVESAEKESDEDFLLNGEKESDEDDDADEERFISLTELDESNLIERLKALIDENIDQVKSEVESIKLLFYKKHNARIESQKSEFIREGGDVQEFTPEVNEWEDEFKNLYNAFKEKRAQLALALTQERENNLLRKTHIIEQIKQLVESKEDVSANINTFRELQQDWKNTGSVPPADTNELWRQYNQQQEAFWDLIKINNELREYDFRKNLEAKTKLIEAAETLNSEEDIVTAFRKLQKLHDKWRELGPVAREMRENVWTQFKEASTVINKKHQLHFDTLREIENRNLELKAELCEKVEAVETAHLNNYKAWDEATKTILAYQEEWRSIGFAPRKSNQKIFERYRAACDTFFAAKSEFYKEMKSNLNENYDKKRALCEKAEALKESTDWKETTDEFIKIQKEWKTIGPVQKKYSDEIWKRFIAACDHFFEQRNKNMSGKRSEELKNMELKKEITEKIKAFTKTDNTSESLTKLRALAAEWNAVGHVPYRDKDKIYKAYRTALDAKFDELNVDVTERRMESFRSNLKDMSSKGENKLYREREKLMRAYDHLKSEIATYENNIGFLSISSKKGGGMLQEMQRKIETLKEECSLLEQKINLIDEQI